MKLYLAVIGSSRRTPPESEQNLLLLRYWIGLSHKEVAQALGLPEGTVRRQCAEALGRLREMLDEPPR